MSRQTVTASPEPESGPSHDRGQADDDKEQGNQVTVSEEPASMSSSPSSSNHSLVASPSRSPKASTDSRPTSPSPSRPRRPALDGEGEGEQQQDQQQQQTRTSSPPPSSSPVQADGDQGEGESASPLAASPTSEKADPFSTLKPGGSSTTESSETEPQEGRQEESSAGTRTRQTSREYKETLDAKTKDEKDGTRMLNQYHLTRVIGQGAYGVVFEGRLRDNASEIFAVKELSKTRLKKSRRSEQLRRPGAARGGLRGRGLQRGPSRGTSSDREEDKDPLELIRREIAIMKKLNHPNIISLHEVLDDPSRDELYMVVEYCPGGVIIDVKLHERTTPLKEEVARSYFVQILLGIEYLHSSDIVHRDIKPANILLAEDGKTCKIVDFGVSELFAPSEKPADAVSTARGQGTPAFLSPEICSARAPSSRKSTDERRPFQGEGAGSEKAGVKSERETSGYRDDLWALGVTLYCMVVGHLPFDKSGFMDLYEAICHEEPEYPSHLSLECVDLLQKFLMKDAEKRITIEDAREHQWVTLAGTAPIPSAAKNLSSVVSEITEDELRKAIRRVSGVFAVARAVTKFKRRKSTARSTGSSANGEGGQSSNERQGSMLWPSSSNPSSPQVQQGPYDSPEASPSVSRAGSMFSSLTGGESGLGLTSTMTSLKAIGTSGGQSGPSNERARSSSEQSQKSADGAETDSREPEQTASSSLSPMSWARSAASSASLRSGAAGLTSAINTAASAGASTIGLGTIAEVNTPGSPDNKSGWSLFKGSREAAAQEDHKDDSGSVDIVQSPRAEGGQEGSDTPTKVESPSSEDTKDGPLAASGDGEQRRSQTDRLHASLQALETRLEALMRKSDPTAAKKHLSNRLQQAGPLDRLSAGLKSFGLDKIAAALGSLTGHDAASPSKGEEAGKEDADQSQEDEDEGSDERPVPHRPDSLIKPDHLQEDKEGHNVHTGRKTSRGTASSGVKVDRFSERQEYWGRARGERSSSALGDERPHLFGGPVVESPLREEVPMHQAVQTLNALVPEGDDRQEQGEGKKTDVGSAGEGMGSSKGSGSGKNSGSGDYFTSSLGPKSKAAAKQGERQDHHQQQPDEEGGSLPSAATSVSPGAIDPHSGRIEGEVQAGEDGEKRYIQRPAVGEPREEDKHEPPVELEPGAGTGDKVSRGGGSSSKKDPGERTASPETRKKGGAATDADTRPREDTQTQTSSKRQPATIESEAAAGPISAEDSLPASGFGDDDQAGQGDEGQEGEAKDRKKGGQGAAVL